jgi:hypothetical protein
MNMPTKNLSGLLRHTLLILPHALLGLILGLSLPTLVLAPGTAHAAADSQPIEVNPAHPDRYVVVKGDTLWDISGRFLTKPWLWPEVWYANPQIANPHLIYPGDVITLVYVDGRPQLRLERGGPLRLSPRARVLPLEDAIPTIPADAIQQFLSRTRVVDKGELEAAPYIVESADEHLITGAGDRIYVRGIADESYKRYTVLRQGKPYVDPDTNEVLGHEAIFIADADVQRYGDPATLLLVESNRESLIGDRLLPAIAADIKPTYLPRAPDSQIEGRIISVLDGVTQIGQYQVVVLNRGGRDGLDVGHVLAVYQAGQVVPDKVTASANDSVRLPDEYAGVVMVFRVFDRVSYALVMRATRAIHVLDKVKNP